MRANPTAMSAEAPMATSSSTISMTTTGLPVKQLYNVKQRLKAKTVMAAVITTQAVFLPVTLTRRSAR